MSYQSFPFSSGDSESFTKLSALHLPPLTNKKVLDVGCNTGFFCGFADFQKASYVMGIDIDKKSIQDAKLLFPSCTFKCMDWKNLNQEKFDVIIFISAIHYADDQEAMINFLMEKLEDNGLLVLEIGIAEGDEEKFIEIKRSIDTRLFPTYAKLKAMLAKYAYKFISRSVNQIGDPIPRYVIHIYKKRPYAILLNGIPYSGKTTIARSIFKDNIRYFSGDELFYKIDQIADIDQRIKSLVHEEFKKSQPNFGILITRTPVYT